MYMHTHGNKQYFGEGQKRGGWSGQRWANGEKKKETLKNVNINFFNKKRNSYYKN